MFMTKPHINGQNNRVFVCRRVSRTASRSCGCHLLTRHLFPKAAIVGVSAPYNNADVDDACSDSDDFA